MESGEINPLAKTLDPRPRYLAILVQQPQTMLLDTRDF